MWRRLGSIERLSFQGLGKRNKEGENKGKKAMEEGERKKERKRKGQNEVVYWERRRKLAKRNEGAWLTIRKTIIFWDMVDK